MSDLEKKMIDRGFLTEDELNKKIFSLSDLYAGIMNSIGKVFIAICILLILIVISITAGSVLFSLYTISILSVLWLIKYRKSFLPGISATTSIMVLVSYYIDSPIVIGTIAILIYMIISFFLKNKEMLVVLPLGIYAYIILLLTQLTRLDYKNIILTIGVINFFAMTIMLLYEDKIRRSRFGEKYIIFLLETIAFSMFIMIYYQFELITTLMRIDNFWWIKSSNFLIVNSLYIIANLFIILRSNRFTKDIKLINSLIVISTIKVPFLSFCFFLYNLALIKRWNQIKTLSFYGMIIALWLIYYTLEVSLLVKSIGVALVGALMIVAYVILNKRGVYIEE